MPVICKVPLDDPKSGASDQWQLVTPTGSTLSLPDGTVLSCQPDGSFQTRPKGTAGAYEQVGINGNVAVYCPAGKPFAYLYVAQVPNQ